MKKLILMALALVFLVSGAAWAQTGGVAGVVVDRNGVPVEGARVSLQQDDHCCMYVLTAGDGSFYFQDVPVGVYLLHAGKQRVGSAVIQGVEVLDGHVTDVGTVQIVGKFICDQDGNGPGYQYQHRHSTE